MKPNNIVVMAIAVNWLSDNCVSVYLFYFIFLFFSFICCDFVVVFWAFGFGAVWFRLACAEQAINFFVNQHTKEVKAHYSFGVMISGIKWDSFSLLFAHLPHNQTCSATARSQREQTQNQLTLSVYICIYILTLILILCSVFFISVLKRLTIAIIMKSNRK